MPDRITIGIASIPSREASLQKVIDRFSNPGKGRRIPDINVYLDGYQGAPGYLYAPHIQVFRSKPESLADAGKFVEVPTTGIYLSCDDDIEYPANYLTRITAGLKKHGGIVTFHGSILRRPFRSYYASRTLYRAIGDVANDTRVDVPGTGVMAFRCEDFRPEPKWFEWKLMTDIWIGIYAHKQGLPVTCLAHKAGWLQSGAYKGIYEHFRGRDGKQTTLCRRNFPL